jgi:hypothetical protein
LQSITFYEGVDYIEFIDLNSELASESGEVVPDTLGQDSSDYYSAPIFVDQGIPIGAVAELSTTLYVR